MLQTYSTVYENTSRKINSHAYITKTCHEGKPLPIGTFVLKRNFTHVHFSDKLKPLRIGPYKTFERLSDVTYELLAQDGSTIHVHRNHLILYYPKNHFFIHICVVSCAFQTQFNSKSHNLPNMQTVILPLLTQTNPYETKTLKHS